MQFQAYLAKFEGLCLLKFRLKFRAKIRWRVRFFEEILKRDFASPLA